MQEKKLSSQSNHIDAINQVFLYLSKFKSKVSCISPMLRPGVIFQTWLADTDIIPQHFCIHVSSFS